MKIIGIVVAVFFSIVGALAWLLPEKGATYTEAFLKWLVAIPLSLVAWLALEWVGTTLLSLPFWQRMPSFARVTLLVVSIVILIAAVIVVVQLVRGPNAL
ncbi:MAG: hypothetical protein ACOY3V_07870 [Pseudomonadota bacterium]